MIPVSFSPNPFDAYDIRSSRVVEGKTLLEIVGDLDIDADLVQVCINGERIPREWWSRVKPKAAILNDLPTLVTVHPLPQGGKALGTILTVLAVVAVIAATAVSGGALGPAGFGLLGSAFAAGGLGATAAAAGLGLAGSLAFYAASALTAPPIQPVGGAATKQTAGVSQNSIDPGDYLPMVLGKVRSSPPPLMPAYTTLENGELFVNGIVGLAGAYLIENIWLNGSPIDFFPSVQYSTRQGLLSDTAPDLNYTYSVQEQLPRLKMSQNDRDPDSDDLVDDTTPSNSYSDYHIFNVHPPGDNGKVVVRLHWATGMNHIQPDDGLAAGALALRIEIRPRSSLVWYKLPDLHFRQKKVHNSEVRQNITLQWGLVDAPTYSPHATNTAWAAYWRAAPGHGTLQRDAEAVYTGVTEEYAAGVTSDKDGFTVQIDNTAMDGDEEYDIRFRMSSGFTQSAFNTATQVYSGSIPQGQSLFGHFNTKDTIAKSESAAEHVYVESVASYKEALPFEFLGLASIAFKARGIQIQSLSAEFTSIVPVWDGVSWANLAPTKNPAALYRFVCLDPTHNAQPIPGEILDEDTILEWFLHCLTMDYECNCVIQNESVPSVLQKIASAGWASPRYNDVWSVVMERDRSGEDIVQLLTPLNSKDGGTTKEFPKMPHAIRVEYFSENEEYTFRDNVVVYAPGFDANTASIFESIRYDGITSADRAAARAQFDINQIYLRSIRYVRDVHQEGFLAPRGSLVGLADDVVEQAQRYAIISEVLTDTSGAVTGFVLETVLDLNALATDIWNVSDPFALLDPFHPTSQQFGITIRLDNGSPSTHLVDGSIVGDTVILQTPFLNTGDLFRRGQLAALGPAGYEFKRCLVMAVEPHQGGEMFRLYLADERPELHAIVT